MVAQVGDASKVLLPLFEYLHCRQPARRAGAALPVVLDQGAVLGQAGSGPQKE